MGVPGLLTLFKRRQQWCTNVRLKETKLVIDMTDEMYWFVKSRLLSGQENNSDKFGMSMVKYGQFVRQFIERLRSAKITPIIVYNGARLSEKLHGDIVSKARHLEKSARVRMYLMTQRGHPRHLDHQIIPSVACNVLKQIVNELQLETHQSTYEVYPLLVRLANENDCPVLTSHRDFIFANVRQGFLLFEEFDPTPRHHQLESEIASGKLYKHQLMLGQLSRPQCGPALYCLNVLLRPDFCGRYFEVVNRMFKMPSNLKFIRDNTEFVSNHRPKNQPWRVEYILNNWPSGLNDPDSVRRTFEQHAREVFTQTRERVLADYDALYLSFSDANDRDNIVNLLSEQLGPIVGLQDALTKRESTAPFITDILMGQTNIDRLRIEDLDTFRSTYSLADAVKLLLMNRGGNRRQAELPQPHSPPKSLKIIDRQRSQLRDRTLNSSQLVDDFEAPDQMLYEVFLFPSHVASPSLMRAFIRDSRQSAQQLMKISLAFKDEFAGMSEQIIVLLLLVKFATKLGFRDDYELPTRATSPTGRSRSPQPAATAAGSKSQSGSLTEKLRPIEAKYKKILPLYLDAMYNTIMYYCFKKGYLKERMEEAELLCNDQEGGFYAKVNVAVQEIESNKINKPSDVSNHYYLEIKHLNEMVNSALHAYMELNSFYNHPGAVLKLADYFDCPLIYKICHYMMQASRSNTSLLTIEKTDRLYSLLSDGYTS